MVYSRGKSGKLTPLPPSLPRSLQPPLHRIPSLLPPPSLPPSLPPWDSAQPALCATAWSLQRLDSAQPPGVGATWTWRCLSQL